MLDTISYTNPNGQTVDLRSSTIRSNPKAAKAFSYASENNSFYSSSKEFALNLVLVGNSVANDAIVKLTYGANKNAYGVLTVNGWNLRCKCIGVSSVVEDEWGVVSLVANFFAPDSRWYKKSSTWQTFVDNDSIVLPHNASFDVKFNYTTTSASEFNCAFINSIGNAESVIIQYNWSASGTANVVRAESDSVEKTFVNIANIPNTPLWEDLDNSSNIFDIVSAGNYIVRLWDTTVTDYKYKIVEWSDLPPWLIT